MTVSYQSDVASSTSGGLIRLLWRWRGSVWKLVYKELLLFVVSYVFLSFSYDFLFPDPVKRVYEKIVIVCSAFVELIPLPFILGFYVSFTASRWWNQYTAIPWPDKIMNNIAMYIPGIDEDSRILRRTLMRYLNLTLVLVLRSISIAVKRRFPTKEHLVEAGFMTRPELEMFSAVPATEFNTFWIPCTWFVNLLRDARQECRITDSSGLKLIMEEFNEFRSKCGLLWSYDWVSIPLVYTQVVTISTYAFFVASVFGRQHINPPKYPDLFLTEMEHRGEFYIPVFTILQFLLYMGLLKLGEQLINPFGDDDEDFELNWIIDRHIKVSFLGVDVLNSNPPPIMKDNYFDESDIKLPYTAAAVSYKKKTYRGSMAAYHVPSEQQGLVVPDFEEDDTQEPDYQTLLKSDNRSRDSSLWSMIGSKVKQASASIVSLDSENLDTLDDRDIAWHSTLSLSVQELPMAEMTRPLNDENIGLRDECQQVNQPSRQQQLQLEQSTRGDDVESNYGDVSKQSDLSTLPTGRGRLDSLTLFKKRTSCAHITSPSTTSETSNTSQLEGQPHQFDPTLGFFSSMFPSREPSVRKSSSASISKEAVAAIQSPSISRSSSIASKTLFRPMPRMPRAAIIKLRKADPKLTIRPFRSRVTFSEDTKGAPKPRSSGGVIVDRTAGVSSSPQSIYHVPMAKPSRGMRQEGLDLTISSPELSEADLLSAYIEHRDNSMRGTAGSSWSSTLVVPPLSPLKSKAFPLTSSQGDRSSFESHDATAATSASTSNTSNSNVSNTLSKTSSPLGTRKASLGSEDVHAPLYPADLINAIGLPSEYWLRHQSLPNIQEICEDVSSTASGPVPSPTGRSIKRSPTASKATSPTTSEVSRGSIRRQIAQDKSSPPKESFDDARNLSHHSTSQSQVYDKRRRYSANTNNSGGSGNSLGSQSSGTLAATVVSTSPDAASTTLPSNTLVAISSAATSSSSPVSRRYRKRASNKPGSSKSLHSLTSKQSSTESEGSFVTAKSYYIQISEEDESQQQQQQQPPPPLASCGGGGASGCSSHHPSSSKCDLCHQQVSSLPSLTDESTDRTLTSVLSEKSSKPSLMDLKKSSHSTSSSVASYSSAKDIFCKFSPSSHESSPSSGSNLQLQTQPPVSPHTNLSINSLSIPTIVVMKSTPPSPLSQSSHSLPSSSHQTLHSSQVPSHSSTPQQLNETTRSPDHSRIDPFISSENIHPTSRESSMTDDSSPSRLA